MGSPQLSSQEWQAQMAYTTHRPGSKPLKTLCKLILLVALLASATAAIADSLMVRTECTRGELPSSCIGYMRPEGEVWYFKDFSVEVGKLAPVTTSKKFTLLAGAYLSRWESDGKIRFEPYVWFKAGDKLQLKGDLYGYVGSGTRVLGASDISVSLPVGKNDRIGLSGTFWCQNGEKFPVRWGPEYTMSKDKIDTVLRFTPFGGNGDDPCLRLQASYAWN